MKVVIIGGTHGNEKTGAYLVDRWQRHATRLPKSHQYLFIKGNPEALAANRRYVEYDLNRSFSKEHPKAKSYEAQRALELKKMIETWTQGCPYFLIDLHTTTANMGETLVLSKSDLLTAHTVSRALHDCPNIRLLFNSQRDHESIFVDSIAPHGLLVEIGPVAQNLLNAKVIQATEQVVLALLNALNEIEKQASLPEIELAGFLEGSAVEYPQDNQGNIVAMIHQTLQDRDYLPLAPGAPLFETLNGETLPYLGGQITYPVFINEAAYYEKRVALLTSQPTTFTFSP